MCSLPSVLLRVNSCQQSCPAIRGAGLPSPEYRLLQLHFHWGSPGHKGSEHSLDEKHGSMEVGSGWTRRRTGTGNTEQLDTTFGLYFLDAYGPHEHKVPEHGGCTEPTRWACYTGCAVGGEEGSVAPCMFPERGTWNCVEGPGIFRFGRLREELTPNPRHTWAEQLKEWDTRMGYTGESESP